MKAVAFTPSHATGILVADIIPYAGSHDTRLGRESSWPQVPSGTDFFQAADGQGFFCALSGRAAFSFRGNVHLGQCEKLLRYEKLGTSSILAFWRTVVN